VLALHVLTPPPTSGLTVQQVAAAIEAREDAAAASMIRIDSQLGGISHETITLHDGTVWSAVWKTIEERHIDLIVTGTRRRTGANGFFGESVTEEIFRRANVPVLVVGPEIRSATQSAGRFYRILYATDFSPESAAAAPFAVSLAEENESKLLLLHVVRERQCSPARPLPEDSAANIMHFLREAVPSDAEFWCRPEATIRFGLPANQILDVSSEFRADLIVLGVRNACNRDCGNHRLEHTTARAIVAHAKCPVLTVRGGGIQTASFEVNCLGRAPRLT
ncbi:MAG: universal stress protein, partial [Candidatus Acidiferrales bacterium]